MKRLILLALIPIALGIWYYMTATEYPVEVVYYGNGLYSINTEYPLAPAPRFKPVVLHNYSLAAVDFFTMQYVYKGNFTALDISPCRPQYAEYMQCLMDSWGYVYCACHCYHSCPNAAFTDRYGKYIAPSPPPYAPFYAHKSVCERWSTDRKEFVAIPWVATDRPLPQPLYIDIWIGTATASPGISVRARGPPPSVLQINERWYILLPGRYVIWCPRGS